MHYHETNYINLFFLPLIVNAQKLALIDRKFEQSITIVDTVTGDQLTKGSLPVYEKDIATVIELMQRLAKKISSDEAATLESFDIKMGNSKCIVNSEKIGSRYNYNVVLNTSMQNFKTSILLADHEPNKRAAQRINIFVDYLRNNMAAIGERLE